MTLGKIMRHFMADSGQGVTPVACPSQEFLPDELIEYHPAGYLGQSEQTSCFAQGEPFAKRLPEGPEDH